MLILSPISLQESEGESSRGDGRIKSSEDGGERISRHWIRTSFQVEKFLVYFFGPDLGKRVELTFLCYPRERRRRQWATATMIWRTGWQIEWAISTWYFDDDCLFELRFQKDQKATMSGSYDDDWLLARESFLSVSSAGDFGDDDVSVSYT